MDGDGGALTFEGQSRLEALQGQLAEVTAELDAVQADADADADAVRPRLDLLASLPAQEAADKFMRVVAFLLGMWALALLAGAALSTIMAYSGRLNQALVRMNDGGEYRFVEEVRAVRKENDNQPLLGFLLLALTGPTVIPMLLGWAMSILVMLGGTLALPLEGLAFATLDLENLVEMPDFDFEIEVNLGEDDAEMAAMGAMVDAAEVVEESGPVTYTIQGGQSVWRELTDRFGESAWSKLKKANPDISDWGELVAGDEILLPDGME